MTTPADHKLHISDTRDWRAQGNANGFDEIVIVGLLQIERMNGNEYFVDLAGTRGWITRSNARSPWSFALEKDE